MSSKRSARCCSADLELLFSRSACVRLHRSYCSQSASSKPLCSLSSTCSSGSSKYVVSISAVREHRDGAGDRVEHPSPVDAVEGKVEERGRLLDLGRSTRFAMPADLGVTLLGDNGDALLQNRSCFGRLLSLNSKSFFSSEQDLHTFCSKVQGSRQCQLEFASHALSRMNSYLLAAAAELLGAEDTSWLSADGARRPVESDTSRLMSDHQSVTHHRE